MKGLSLNYGCGNRQRGRLSQAAKHGQHTGDLLEFVVAVDQFKRANRVPFPTTSELYQIVLYLGYRKVAEQARSILDVGGPADRRVRPYRHPVTRSIEQIREMMDTPSHSERRKAKRKEKQI